MPSKDLNPSPGSGLPRADAASWFGGDRFEADVSPNRQLVDIADRKELKRMILLDVQALRELNDLTAELLEFMERRR